LQFLFISFLINWYILFCDFFFSFSIVLDFDCSSQSLVHHFWFLQMFVGTWYSIWIHSNFGHSLQLVWFVHCYCLLCSCVTTTTTLISCLFFWFC
jgi:hypothetical protein